MAVNLPYECASICSFCSRMKRGKIYGAARREGYNVLALGQHLDDLAERSVSTSFFLIVIIIQQSQYEDKLILSYRKKNWLVLFVITTSAIHWP